MKKLLIVLVFVMVGSHAFADYLLGFGLSGASLVTEATDVSGDHEVNFAGAGFGMSGYYGNKLGMLFTVETILVPLLAETDGVSYELSSVLGLRMLMGLGTRLNIGKASLAVGGGGLVTSVMNLDMDSDDPMIFAPYNLGVGAMAVYFYPLSSDLYLQGTVMGGYSFYGIMNGLMEIESSSTITFGGSLGIAIRL